MMDIHGVSAFTDNYVWVMAQAGRAVVVDPGDAAPVQAYLEAQGLELTAILATHHHADHVGGLPALVARWGCPTFGPAGERIAGLTRTLHEGDRFDVPGIGITLEVLDIPGHTAGHIAFVKRGEDPLLFCGDTLFACGCGRLFEGTPPMMVASLSKLAALPGATRVFCGHEYTLANIRFAEAVEPGNRELAERRVREAAKRSRGEPTLPSTIALELETNPFLRWTAPEVVAAAERRAGRRLAGPVDVFAEIREWKNNF
ncbi:MAG TPA: hydroxyacylglutathione hydrolase [Usitatibacter sp.]|nr:hydroxyacylglutathione hydrolase [Usitatibacter sp.]